MSWIKRICTGILCMALVLASMPVAVFADVRDPAKAQASSYTSSPELAALLTGVFSGDIDIYSNGGCTSEVSMPIGWSLNKKTTYYLKDKTTGDSIGGRQCYIYANAVYNKLFKELAGHADDLKHSKVVLSGGSNSMSYDKFSKAGVRCGAYLRTTNRSSGAYNGSSGHSMIILSYNTSGVTYLEGNADGNGLIRIDTLSWSSFNSTHLSGRSRYLSHIVQPTDDYYNANFVSYTVTYDANGGTGAPAAQTKKYGKTLTLSNTVPTRKGHTFLGWATAANAATAAYQPGAGFKTNADTTLYALWAKGCPGSHQYQNGQCAHCGAEDPDYTVLTLTASCFGGHTDGVTVSVYPQDSDTALHTLTAENGICEIRGLATGQYTVTFSLVNHVAESYCVNLEAGTSTLDVIIYLVGDLSGDGKVNVSDISQLYTQVKKGNVVSLLRSDINGDGRVNITDASRLYAHIRGTKPLHE